MNFTDSDNYVTVGGDFTTVFDAEDYMAMVNSLDEVSVILHAHLILEEFLNIWSSRLTNTTDIFDGVFVPFKTKLVICKNLGLSSEYVEVFDKFNQVRNKFSHQRKFKLEQSLLKSLSGKVNSLESGHKMLPCEEFEIYLSGLDQCGQHCNVTFRWENADLKKKIVILFIVFILKLVQWMQHEFIKRGIEYKLIVAAL